MGNLENLQILILKQLTFKDMQINVSYFSSFSLLFKLIFFYKAAPKYISTLPNIIWKIIINKCDLSTVLKCMETCKNFYSIGRDSRIWKHFFDQKFSNYYYITKEINIESFHLSPNLEDWQFFFLIFYFSFFIILII